MAIGVTMQGRNFNEMLLFRQAIWTSRHLMITCRNPIFMNMQGTLLCPQTQAKPAMP